jgi:predicted MPP superfamily phosphohydrolase
MATVGYGSTAPGHTGQQQRHQDRCPLKVEEPAKVQHPGDIVKLLHFADLHLDTPFRWAPREVARARRRGLRDTLLRICKLADEQRVDALTCGGDLYEQERFTPDTAEFLRSTFAELYPLPVFLAPGNHDWFGPSSLYHQVKWTPNVHVFGEAKLTPVPLADGITLWGAGHRAPAKTPGFLNRFRVDRDGVHIALFHGSEQGKLRFQESGKVPHAPFWDEQIPQAGLHHALIGHFHHPVDAPNYTYPGNPDPLTFGESGDRATVLLTVAADGAVSHERFPVARSMVNDVAVDLTGVTHSGQVAQRVREALSGRSGVARVTVYGEVGPDVDLRLYDIAALAAPGLDAVVPRLGAVSVAYDFGRLAQEQTVRGQFVRDVLAAPTLTDDQRRRVLVTGLRALDGRTDELDVR